LVKISCDIGTNIGFGHFRRCLSLADFLSTRGWACQLQFLDEGDKGIFATLIPDRHRKVVSASIHIFDSHRDVSRLVALAKSRGEQVVVLDNFIADSRDVSINVFGHEPVEIGRSFVGYEYTILRDDIFGVVPEVVPDPYVAVCLGGADVTGMSAVFARQLSAHGLKPVVVLGPLSKTTPAEFPPGVRVLESPPDFLRLVANADRVVCNCGGVLFESLYLRKRCWVFPQTRYEWNIANDLGKRGCLLGVSVKPCIDLGTFDTVLPRESPIDGKGVARIAEILQRTLAGAF
jgi:spore coat polysaccharide biosynthesis predicted glycosyltransferase SpsG